MRQLLIQLLLFNIWRKFSLSLRSLFGGSGRRSGSQVCVKWAAGLRVCNIGRRYFYWIYEAASCTVPLHVRVLSAYNSLFSPNLPHCWLLYGSRSGCSYSTCFFLPAPSVWKIIRHSLNKHGVNIFARNWCRMWKKSLLNIISSLLKWRYFELGGGGRVGGSASIDNFPVLFK